MSCVYLLDWFELQREAFMLWREEENEKQRTWEKKSFGESDQTAIHTVCF